MHAEAKRYLFLLWKVIEELFIEAMLVSVVFVIHMVIIYLIENLLFIYDLGEKTRWLNSEDFIGSLIIMPLVSFLTRLICGEIILRYVTRLVFALYFEFSMKRIVMVTLCIHIVMFYFTFFSGFFFEIALTFSTFLELTYQLLIPSLFAAVMAPYLLKRLSGSTFDSLIEKRQKKVKQS